MPPPAPPNREACAGKPQSGVGELRRTVVADMRKHPTVFKAFFAQDHVDRPWSARTWEKYLQVMAEDGEWGDNLTLLAIARVLKLRIRLVGPDGEIGEAGEATGPADGRPVWMAFRPEWHYDALMVDPSAAAVAAGASPAPKRSKE